MNAILNMLNSNAGAVPSAPGSSQWNQGYTNSMDNIMLDDFVSELMSLTGPLVGTDGGATAPQTSNPTPSAAGYSSSPLETHNAPMSTQEPSHVATSAPGAQSKNGEPTASSSASQTRAAGPSSETPASAQSKTGQGKAPTPGRTSSRYRKLLDSDAIDSLLSKYSPIYERFWHATLMLLSNKKRQAAVDHLMSVIRSSKACRASVVVVCLSYHELVQRVKADSQKANPKPPAQQAKNAAPNWTTLATDTVHNGKAAAQPSGEGMSQTIVDMFPGDEDDDDDDDSQSIRSDVAEDSNDEDMTHSRMDDDDDADDEDDEPEEEISTIERRRSGDRSYLSAQGKVSAERYGATSFSRRSDPNGRSPLPPARTLTGKLSTVEDKIQEMENPSRDAFKGQIVEEPTVELWFDIAKAELERSREDLTLDQELCAIINLRWACLCFAGAERARQLTQELGKVMQREGIDMDHAAEEEKKGSFVSIMLLTAVYTDVLDTVSDRGKRTHVTTRDVSKRKPAQLSRLRRTSNQAGGEDASTSKDEPFFGRISLVSLELLTCFKLISDLSADVWGPISSTVAQPSRPSETEVAERSREIERKVMSLPPWTDPNTSSSLRVRAFALQEIWRQTARLYLLQAVHRRGPLHPELQNILHEIIRLAKMMKIQSFSPIAPIFTDAPLAAGRNSGSATSHRPAPPNYVGGLRASDPTNDVRDANHPDPVINATFGIDEDDPALLQSAANEDDTAGPGPFQMWLDVASWEMCTVWFLCCTVALTRADRQFCIHHLESLGLERANRDNIQVVRDYWAKMDSTGHTVDWFDFVKGSGRSVIFAF
uniref:Uncharacterized protein n=2 Tax=Kalmanozyma brasiliensis (strain GHG001) TaxID=1365824 RepID=V5F180_KALBG